MATIFLDMDGVVADFDGYAEPIVGFRTPGGVRYDQEGWALISANPRLYSELGEMPDAHRLVSEVQTLAKDNSMDVKFLSAIPRQNDVPWAFWDKIKWIEARWPKIPVWFGPHSNEKCQHCRPGDILIDDRPSNIEEWRAAGGLAILHEGDVVATLFDLRSLVKGMSIK
jgi:5'(3')-deoxyribonucleotidase